MLRQDKKTLGLKNVNNFVRAKKALGQNFLKSSSVIKTIIKTGEISKEDIVLEIGPGKGALTKAILDTGCKLLAIEKDRNLYEILKDKFKEEIYSGQLELINEDVLEFKIQDYKLQKYKIIANIPYNITGAIFKKFLTEEIQPTMMVLMVQNEVAKRIVAKDKKESILSISIKVYGEPKIITKVPARYFSPEPKVDSAVILIKNINKKNFIENKIKEEDFFEILRTGFSHKRKKVSSNLKDIIKSFIHKEGSLTENFGNKRAEELKLEDWINIVKTIQNKEK